MIKFKLKGHKNSFLEIRPIYKDYRYGLSLRLVMKRPGKTYFDSSSEYFWPGIDDVMDSIRRYIMVGNITIPSKPGMSGIRFSMRYINDDISEFSVSGRTDSDNAEYKLTIPTLEANKFFLKLGSDFQKFVKILRYKRNKN